MNSEVKTKNNILSTLLKGVIPSIITTLLLILAFALIIRFFNISNSWIFPINQVIKFVSLTVGITIALRNTKSKGFITGLIIGVSYSIISYLLFSLLQMNFEFSFSNFYDIILTAFGGGLIGIIIVNVFK